MLAIHEQRALKKGGRSLWIMHMEYALPTDNQSKFDNNHRRGIYDEMWYFNTWLDETN